MDCIDISLDLNLYHKLPCCNDGLCIGKLSENIKSKAHEVFLTDFMFFLCQECKVPWQPPCECTYEIDKKSPLHSDICNYVQKSYRKIYAKMKLTWLNYIRKDEEERKENEKQRNKTILVTDEEYINKIISDDYKKGPGQMIEDCDEFLLTQMYLDERQNRAILDMRMIKICDEELRKRRSRLFNFLIHQDMYDVFMEILEASVSFIVLYELGMADAVFSGVTAMIEAFEEYFKKTGRSYDSILRRMTRLAPKLPLDNWPVHMIGKLHEVFTRDILYFMCGVYGSVWYPPKLRSYMIDTKSPFTLDIQKYIERKPLPDPTPIYFKLYSYYFTKQSVLKAFGNGIRVIMKEISLANVPHVKSVEDVFWPVLNMVRLSIELHKRKLYESMGIVYQELPGALRECNERSNGHLFELFNAFAKLESVGRYVLRKAQPLDEKIFLNLDADVVK